MLKASNIYKAYQGFEVLKGVNLSVSAGEIVSIVGSSGAGKSTLLHILGTLDNVDKGEVYLNEKRIDKLKGNALSNFRNTNIGFVFQFHHLLPEFTAIENICMPGWIAKRKKAEVEEDAKKLLSLLGLATKANSKPSQLSGGEQQRIAIARALINKPSIVMADEPTGNLDSANAKALHDLFITLRNELNQSFLIVTHNEELAAMSNRTVHMKDGQIV
jgi:lipoprotein-releasing system ATP-binding protein